MFKKIALITTIILFSAFSANAGSDGELILKKNQPSEVKDCFENLNRATFAFNQALDGILFQPVASAYRVLPSPIKTGVSNSLDNLSTLVTIPNNILQGELKKAGVNSGRFVINTTVGILGFIDVAQHLGFPEYEKEDYGQSLATMGVGPGCYLVLPVLGPSTVRDATASVTNFIGGDAWYNVTVRNETHYFSDIDYYGSKITSGVDFRAKNYDSIENLEENSLDFYASVKSLYVQDRENKINNNQRGNIEVLYKDEEDWEEIDNK